MKAHFVEYLTNLYNYLPGYVFEWLACLFCAGGVLLIFIFGVKKGIRYLPILLFVEYVALIICSTVVFRTYREPAGMNLCPLWSYKAILEGQTQLLNGSFMNVIVFIPLGFLLACSFKHLRWWKVMLICGAISILIETFQFIFERGFTEVDDVIHNVLGSLIGYGMFSIMSYCYERISKRRMAVL